MILELLLAVLIGVSAGIFTGLIPGLHINVVAVAAFALTEAISVNPLFLAAAIVAMSITHTFLDFIPSVFLGAPDPDTAFATLPGHKMLLKGRAYDAIKLTAIGGIFSLLLTIAALPLLIYSVPIIYSFLKPHLPLVLSFFVFLLILKEKKLKKMFFAIIVFLLAGTLGIIVWDSTINQPLFHMLSGLFGISLLLISLRSKAIIPKQYFHRKLWLPKRIIAKSSFLAFISGSLVSIFPGLGPAQAAALVSIKKFALRDYLITIGGINTVSMLFALVTTYTINKARNGSIVIVQKLVEVDVSTLILFAVISIISAAASFFLVLKIAKLMSKVLVKINYQKLCIAVIIFIFSLSFYFAGLAGIAILSIAAIIGLIPVITKVHRSHLMGSLLLPVIIYFL